MKISGFTIVRNAVKYDYPVCEAISSILPLCDEMIVLAGNSDDDTLELVQSINSPKIKIHNSVWDEKLRRGGKVLAEETNKAFDLVSPDSDWAFYIQADEVIHEKYHPAIRMAMEKLKDETRVEGLLFKYRHFYGNYKYVGDSRTWYRHEIRIIRNDKSIRSYRDAQGFRKNGCKLNVVPVDACVYHYGWVRNPYKMTGKVDEMHLLYCGDENNVTVTLRKEDLFDYSRIDSLVMFSGTHPQVMQDRINAMDWDFEHNIKDKKFRLKDRVLYRIEQLTGKRLFEYRNYNII
jgi:glycosyltransferase involved in cell wall biosynthesis